MALQVLSTRHGFTLLGKSHWLNFCACGGAAGGAFSTFACVEAWVLRPRESVHVAVTVIEPAEAPAVLSDAVDPLPETLPPVEVQLLTLTGTLSGLVQLHVMVEVPPACKLDGLAEHDI
jgi:hypothetical protein